MGPTNLVFFYKEDILEKRAFEHGKMYAALFVVGNALPDNVLLERVLMYHMPILCFYGLHAQQWENAADEIIVEKYMDVEPHMCTTVHDDLPEAVSFWRYYVDNGDIPHELACIVLSPEKELEDEILGYCVCKV